MHLHILIMLILYFSLFLITLKEYFRRIVRKLFQKLLLRILVTSHKGIAKIFIKTGLILLWLHFFINIFHHIYKSWLFNLRKRVAGAGLFLKIILLASKKIIFAIVRIANYWRPTYTMIEHFILKCGWKHFFFLIIIELIKRN